jgi:ATP-binding cassette subfamily C (CFTR/MRP) protein 4
MYQSNLMQLGLYDLRRNISIVPQSPVLFSGTIRRNIDPFKKCSEAEMWDVLEKCDLKTTVMLLPNKLDYEVSEYGENFSAGQVSFPLFRTCIFWFFIEGL